MKKWAKSLLLAGAMLGALSLTTVDYPNRFAYAASTAGYDQLVKQISSAVNQRLGSYQVSYSGNLSSLTNTINSALSAAINGDDYTHYIVKSYQYSATTTGNKAMITFRFTYWETFSQTNGVKTRVKQILSQILTPGMNDHQKEKAIHDWIVGHVAYDTRLISHSAYDGLFNGKTVCQGYALLTYEMMKQAGIPVKIVEGSSRGISHAWNLVQIGGKWYQLDCTWDDPVPDLAGRILYDYYNLTDDQIRADHRWKALSSYPLAITPYDQTLINLKTVDAGRAAFYAAMYHNLGYAYLTDAYTATNLQSLTEKMKYAIKQRQKVLVIRYVNGGSVAFDIKRALAQQIGFSHCSYTYVPFTRTAANDKLLHLTFTY